MSPVAAIWPRKGVWVSVSKVLFTLTYNAFLNVMLAISDRDLQIFIFTNFTFHIYHLPSQSPPGPARPTFASAFFNEAG